jgi:serine protease Do
MPFPGFPNSPFDEFLRRFFDQQGLENHGGPAMPKRHVGQRVALGSGFIIDPSGYIVTNNHVVGDADKVTVIFQDQTKHPAKIIGRDDKTDLALLKIDAKKPLPYVKWGDSDAAKVGDWVIAVGNPFGLGGTVTTGIVSARGRDIHAGPFDDFLQLDAAINRGNSGGPTFNMQGEVIGINTAIYSPNGGSVGIGFAIPSNMAQQVIGQLKDHGSVSRGWLGVQIQQITPEIAKGLGLNPDHPQGALVADVQPNSPASKAGLKTGDVITKFDGQTVDTMHDLPRMVANAGIDKTVDMTVLRNGKTQSMQVTLGELKGHDKMAKAQQNDEQSDEASPSQSSALGLKLAPLNEGIKQRLKVGENASGVVVTDVAGNSPLAEIGVQPGDVIVAVNQQEVKSPSDAATKLKAAGKERNILLLLNRHGTQQYVGLSLEGGNGHG